MNIIQLKKRKLIESNKLKKNENSKQFGQGKTFLKFMQLKNFQLHKSMLFFINS